jgi:2-succinyl-6-hydroxy-2,4-cyclohexadiene-1-carboxylate synthase
MPSDPSPPRPPDPARPTPALHVEARGHGPRLALAHGFTQTGQVWGGLDDDLARDHRVVAVDMPGHGRSAPVAADLGGGAALLGDTVGPAVYVGYSMGARFCLHLALARPGLVGRLVLISGTAGLEDDGERRARQQADEALADQLDPPAGAPGQALPVASFVRRWLDGPLFAGISPEAGGFDRRLANTGPGLASSLRLAGTGTQQPQWEALPTLGMPVLIISGGDDEKFTTLGRRMAEAVGANAVHVVVDGTGHAPHLQRPDEVARLIRTHEATTALAGPGGVDHPNPRGR